MPFIACLNFMLSLIQLFIWSENAWKNIRSIIPATMWEQGLSCCSEITRMGYLVRHTSEPAWWQSCFPDYWVIPLFFPLGLESSVMLSPLDCIYPGHLVSSPPYSHCVSLGLQPLHLRASITNWWPFLLTLAPLEVLPLHGDLLTCSAKRVLNCQHWPEWVPVPLPSSPTMHKFLYGGHSWLML